MSLSEASVARGREAEAVARFDAFLSYAGEDAPIAEQLHRSLQRFARRWATRRALRIFRDEENLAATPELRSELQLRIADARYFVLVASPNSAASPWVEFEVASWLDARGSENFLIVLVDGEIVVDSRLGAVSADRTTALAPTVAERLRSEPRYVDLRSCQRTEDGRLRADGIYAERVADLAAPIHGRERDDLIGADLREFRRGRRIRRAAVAALAALTVLALVGALVAVGQRDRAREQRDLATASALASSALAKADADLDQALVLAAAAYDTSPTLAARDALHTVTAKASQGVERFLRFPPDSDPPINLTRAAVSPSGRYLVLASYAELGYVPIYGNEVGDHRLAIWDLEGGADDVRFIETAGNSTRTVTFGADDGLVVTSVSGSTELWDVETGRQLLSSVEDSTFLWNSDRSALAIVSEEADEVLLVDGRDGTLIARHQATYRPDGVTPFSPNGRRLAGLDEHGAAVLWPVDGGAPTVLDVGDLRVDRLRFVDDETVLGTDGQILQRFDASSGAAVGEPVPLPSGLTDIHAVQVDPAGRRVLLADSGGAFALVSLRGPADPVVVAPAEPIDISSFVVSPDGAHVAIPYATEAPTLGGQAEQYVAVLDTDTFAGVAEVPGNRAVFGPSGARVAVWGGDDVWTVEVATNGTERVPDTTVAGMSDDGRYLVTADLGEAASSSVIDLDRPCSVDCGGMPTTLVVAPLPMAASESDAITFGDDHLFIGRQKQGAVIYSIDKVFSPFDEIARSAGSWLTVTERFAVSLDIDDRLVATDLSTRSTYIGPELEPVEGSELYVEVTDAGHGVLTISSGSIVPGEFGRKVFEWDPISGAVSGERTEENVTADENMEGELGPYAYSFVEAAEDGSDASTELRRPDGTLVATVPWTDQLPPALAYDPVHDRIATVTERGAQLRVIDATDGTTVLSAPERSGAFGEEGLSFSADGTLLAMVSNDAGIVRTRVWDVARSRVVSIIDADATLFSADAALLASDEPRLYDVASGRPIGETLPGFGLSADDISFRADGRELQAVTASRVAVVPVDDDRLRTYACTIAGRTLSAEEWSTNVPEIEPLDTCAAD